MMKIIDIADPMDGGISFILEVNGIRFSGVCIDRACSDMKLWLGNVQLIVDKRISYCIRRVVYDYMLTVGQEGRVNLEVPEYVSR